MTMLVQSRPAPLFCAALQGPCYLRQFPNKLQEGAAAVTEGANTLMQQMFLPACVCLTVLESEGFVSIFNEISTSVQTLSQA